MSNLKLPKLDYVSLYARFNQSKFDELQREGKSLTITLGYMTTARLEYGGIIVILHHGNVIARMTPMTLVLKTGGWNSITTASRLHKLLCDSTDLPGRRDETGVAVGVRQGLISLFDSDRKTIVAFDELPGSAVAFLGGPGKWKIAPLTLEAIATAKTVEVR